MREGVKDFKGLPRFLHFRIVAQHLLCSLRSIISCLLFDGNERRQPRVERRLPRLCANFFELQDFCVGSAFSRTKLTGQLQTWHSKSSLSTLELNTPNAGSFYADTFWVETGLVK